MEVSFGATETSKDLMFFHSKYVFHFVAAIVRHSNRCFVQQELVYTHISLTHVAVNGQRFSLLDIVR